jgi:hypothetical protein
MTSLINSAFLARRLWDLYAGEICSVYRARHRINHRNEKSTARDDKPTNENEFKDDNDDCHNEESTARNDKPTPEDEFEDDNENCRNIESTARDNKLTAEDEFEDDNDDCCNEESTARNDKPTDKNEFNDDNDDCRNVESNARDDKPTAGALYVFPLLSFQWPAAPCMCPPLKSSLS